MRRTVAAALLAGCWSGAVGARVGPPPRERAPTIELIAIANRTATLVRASDTGVVVVATVALPNDVDGLAWTGRDPIALLGEHPWDESPDSTHEGDVGTISAAGFAPIAMAEWPEPEVPADPDISRISPKWTLTVDPEGAAWVGRCDYWGGPDGGGCAGYRYMAVAAPHAIVTAEPREHAAWPAPEIAPSTSTIVKLVPEVLPPPDPDGDTHDDAPTPRKLLVCRRGGERTEYPALEERNDFYGMGEITWITTEPPMYSAAEYKGGFSGVTVIHMFEGCAPSPDYERFTLATGPSDFVAIAAHDKTSIRWRGRELGTLGGAELVVFAPTVR